MQAVTAPILAAFILGAAFTAFDPRPAEAQRSATHPHYRPPAYHPPRYAPKPYPRHRTYAPPPRYRFRPHYGPPVFRTHPDDFCRDRYPRGYSRPAHRYPHRGWR